MLYRDVPPYSSAGWAGMRSGIVTEASTDKVIAASTVIVTETNTDIVTEPSTGIVIAASRCEMVFPGNKHFNEGGCM